MKGKSLIFSRFFLPKFHYDLNEKIKIELIFLKFLERGLLNKKRQKRGVIFCRVNLGVIFLLSCPR